MECKTLGFLAQKVIGWSIRWLLDPGFLLLFWTTGAGISPTMSSAIKNWVSNPAENHGPLISVVLWCLWLFCGIFLGLRMYVRLQHRRFWWDDALLILAWVFLLAQVILMQLSIDLGFGKHILDSTTSPERPSPLNLPAD